MVDLPEPDGPQTTMRSPRMTLRLMFLRTWKSPYHLFISTISIATSVVETSALTRFLSLSVFVSAWFAIVPYSFLSPATVAGVQSPLGVDGVARHPEAERPENERSKGIAGRWYVRPGPVL